MTSKAAFLITESSLTDKVEQFEVNAIMLDALSDRLEKESTENPIVLNDFSGSGLYDIHFRLNRQTKGCSERTPVFVQPHDLAE